MLALAAFHQPFELVVHRVPVFGKGDVIPKCAAAHPLDQIGIGELRLIQRVEGL